MKFAVRQGKLTNGVRTLIVPMPGVESVTALVLVKTGSRNEEERQAGISHVLEHMLFKGTKRYPTALALAEEVDQLGAIHNAFTSKEYTGYYITSAARHLPRALEILASMVTEPLLPKAELRREREVIVQEIKMYEDHPMERVEEEFENLLYAGNRLGRLIIGTEETVRKTEVEDLRAYRRKWYRGGNVLLVMAGKVEGPVGIERFGELAKGGVEPFVERASYGKERELYITKKTEQVHLVVGVPAVAMDDLRRYSLQVAQVVLGGNMSSRLFNEVREKRGLAYYIRARLDANADAGQLVVRAGVEPEKLEETLAIIKKEMFRLAETLTEKEVRRAKEYLLGKLPLQLEGTMEVAQFFGVRALIKEEIRQPEAVAARLKKVTREQVSAVWRELAQEEELRTCVVGPKRK